MKTKQSLRQEMRAKLKALSPEDRAKKSFLIHMKLERLDAYRRARTVCFYVAMPTEVDTVPMIEKALSQGKRVLVPRVNHLEKKELKVFEIRDVRADLRPGVLGILEPNPARSQAVDAREVECVVVPGLAFDSHHRRLGRGGGFYDKFLGSLPGSVFKVGIAFSFQMFPEIPQDIHDVVLDDVLIED